jgi:hypothetical protein
MSGRPPARRSSRHNTPSVGRKDGRKPANVVPQGLGTRADTSTEARGKNRNSPAATIVSSANAELSKNYT